MGRPYPGGARAVVASGERSVEATGRARYVLPDLGDGLTDATCPSCGAPLPTRNPGVVATVCEYCNTLVTWDADAARDSGKKSRLPTGFTRLYTGATGALKGKRFTVMGRVRYSTDGALWDEWAVRFDDTPPGSDGVTWITEDDHELAVENGRQRVDLSADSVLVGRQLDLLGHTFVIEEVGEAHCEGVEGQLPKGIFPGERYRYADGTTPDGRHTVGIEWDDGQPMVFVGRWANPAEIELDDEGVDW